MATFPFNNIVELFNETKPTEAELHTPHCQQVANSSHKIMNQKHNLQTKCLGTYEMIQRHFLNIREFYIISSISKHY